MKEDDLLLLHDWFQKPHIQQCHARGEPNESTNHGSHFKNGLYNVIT